MKMRKIYTINQMCYINQNNPTPSKDDFDIAVNIVPCEPNDEFENFVLGIEDGTRKCCEHFGAGILNPPKKDKVFVKEIEVFTDIDISEELTEISNALYINRYKVVKISTQDEGDIYAYVYNEHSGYYYHTIFYSNDELKIDVYDGFQL